MTDTNVSGAIRRDEAVGDQSGNVTGSYDPSVEADLSRPDDWGHFGSLVVRGLALRYNDGGPSLVVGAGRAHVYRDGEPNLALSPQASSSISLTATAENYVYLAADLGNDQLYIHTDTNATPPSDPNLRIGVVDTDNDRAVPENRHPLARFLVAVEDGSNAPVAGEMTTLVAGEALDVEQADDDPHQIRFSFDAATAESGVANNPSPIERQPISNGGEEFFREHIKEGQRLELKSFGVQPDGLSSITDLTAEMVDEGDSTVLAQTESKREDGNPIETVGGPADLKFRISNSTGSEQTASGTFVYSVIAGELANVIDSMEDSDMSEYTGDTGQVTTVTSTTSHKTWAAEMTGDGSGVAVASTSGLNDDDYPAQGDSWGHDVHLESGAIGWVLFGVQPTNPLSNHYRVELDQGNNTVALAVVDGGTRSELTSESATLPSGEFLTVLLNWASDGDITVTVEDASGSQLVQFVKQDTTYTSGGIGIGEGS